MNIKGMCFVYLLVVLYIYLDIFSVNVYGLLSTDLDSKHCISRNFETTCNYIPADIPEGTKTVTVRNFPERILSEGLFSTNKWGEITKLEILADEDWLVEHDTIEIFDINCFFGLKSLEVLRIGILENITIAPESFVGLENLKNLDLSGCRRLYLEDVLNAIDHYHVLPNIQNLNLARLNNYRAGMTIDDRFFRIIEDKKVRMLDMSSTQIQYLNMTAFLMHCNYLKYINISSVRIDEIDVDRKLKQSCPNLDSIDASYIMFPSSFLPFNGQTNIIQKNANIPINVNWIRSIGFLRNIRMLNLAGLIPRWVSYSFDNLTISVFGASGFKLKSLILRENNFDRMDLKLIIPNCTFEKIDLSGCNIRYLHPDSISSFRLLTNIDLSRNRLNSMIEQNVTLFGKLFQKLPNLRIIHLASNDITILPKNIFFFNIRIEVINLSDNQIRSLSFEVRHLKSLRVLDLSKNGIQIIDPGTFNSFNSIRLLLEGNPIECSRCDTLHFIKWIKILTSNTSYNSELKCRNENSKKVFINDDTIDDLQDICNRPKIIIISCSASALALGSIIVVVIAIRRYRRKLEMEDRIALVKQEDDKYVVFLSYSSCDDHFINRYVFNQLNESLQQKLGTDRDLVCDGDKHFQLGRTIPEQISVFLKKSYIVVVLLTDHYSQSVHCRNEFDQATLLEKPIILMVKDEVNTETMSHQIRDLYEKRTRILWAQENGEYVLNTSWENVCTSIIELVDST